MPLRAGARRVARWAAKDGFAKVRPIIRSILAGKNGFVNYGRVVRVAHGSEKRFCEPSWRRRTLLRKNKGLICRFDPIGFRKTVVAR